MVKTSLLQEKCHKCLTIGNLRVNIRVIATRVATVVGVDKEVEARSNTGDVSCVRRVSQDQVVVDEDNVREFWRSPHQCPD